MAKLLRKTWPRVRSVTIGSSKFFRVDARRRGTLGKQETFKSKEKALDRASEIDKEFENNGSEGLALSGELRSAAITAEKLLKPFGKSVVEAAQFYVAHLESRITCDNSETVERVATEWHKAKEAGKSRKLRADTLRGIAEARDLLIKNFGQRRILAVSTGDLRKYLDGLHVSHRRRFNLASLFSQFFNWSIAGGYTTANPAATIDIEVPTSDIEILSPSAALALMKKCRESYKDLAIYHAVSLFAGLRPNECRQLTWENIHLGETTITVLGKTSKTKETRNVHIEPTLLAWLEEYRPEKLAGSILPHRNFTKRTQALRAELGYSGSKEGEEGAGWPQDVLRHSYGSYWLAKYGNRAQLAENMGNSAEVIKKHYKKVVSKSAVSQYWMIVPGYEGEGITKSAHLSAKDVRKARMERVAKSLANRK